MYTKVRLCRCRVECPAGEAAILGKNIVKLRTLKALTQEHLAEKAEISHRYLQSIEAGKKQPSINVVARLRSGLDCSWDELLEGI